MGCYLGNPELYSMIDDPQENFNVAGELAYAEVGGWMKKFKKILLSDCHIVKFSDCHIFRLS